MLLSQLRNENKNELEMIFRVTSPNITAPVFNYQACAS